MSAAFREALAELGLANAMRISAPQRQELESRLGVATKALATLWFDWEIRRKSTKYVLPSRRTSALEEN